MQIDERPGFQNWFWGVQRIGWAVLVLAAAAALAGLSGAGGWLAFGESQGSKGRVNFSAVMRMDRPETFQFRGELREVTLDERFLEMFEIGNIMPLPSRRVSVAGAVTLIFDGTGVMNITMSVTPKKVFRQHVGLSLGTEQHDLSIFVLP